MESRLEVLRNIEEVLSTLCIKQERQHKEMVQRRGALRSNLLVKKAEVEAILQKLNQLKQTIEEDEAEYIRIANDMTTVSEKHAKAQKKLSETREEIRLLEKVTFSVGNDGNICVENGEVPEIGEEELNTVFTKVLLMPEAEELRIKEIRAVAKMTLIAIKLEGKEFEVKFEDHNAQALYQAVAIDTGQPLNHKEA